MSASCGAPLDISPTFHKHITCFAIQVHTLRRSNSTCIVCWMCEKVCDIVPNSKRRSICKLPGSDVDATLINSGRPVSAVCCKALLSDATAMSTCQLGNSHKPAKIKACDASWSPDLCYAIVRQQHLQAGLSLGAEQEATDYLMLKPDPKAAVAQHRLLHSPHVLLP